MASVWVSLMANKVKPLFMCLWATFIFLFFDKCLFMSFAHFLNCVGFYCGGGGFVLWSLICKCSLYIIKADTYIKNAMWQFWKSDSFPSHYLTQGLPLLFLVFVYLETFLD